MTSPVKEKTGKVAGSPVVAHDVTSHKQGEVASRLSERVLAALLKKRVLAALKRAPVVVIMQDLQLHCKWVTSPVSAWDYRNLLGSTDAGSFGAGEVRRFLGSTEAEILGEEQVARFTAIRKEVLRTGEGSHTEVAVTFEGMTRHFEVMVEPYRDARGTLLGITCTAIDIAPWKYQIAKLKEVLDQVRLLSGLVPICASCKKIKDEREVWQPLEAYIQAHSEAKFSHGVCPDCLRKLYPEYYSQ